MILDAVAVFAQEIDNDQKCIAIHLVHLADFLHRLVTETQRHTKTAQNLKKRIIVANQVTHLVSRLISSGSVCTHKYRFHNFSMQNKTIHTRFTITICRYLKPDKDKASRNNKTIRKHKNRKGFSEKILTLPI